MSKMGQELDRKLDEAKYDMYEALRDIVGYAMYFESDKVGDGNAHINRREIAKAREALAKVEKI